MAIISCKDPTRTLLAMQQLCLNEFKLNLYQKNEAYSYDGYTTGAFWSIIFFVEKGAIELKTPHREYVIKAGEACYVPKGSRFFERSVGELPMKYYLLNFSFKSVGDTFFDEKFDITKITSLSGGDIKNFFEGLFKNISSDLDHDNVCAFADFYKFLAKIIPDLDHYKPQILPQVLVNAIEYINEHLLEDFSMEELAEACYVSQSRLFHLFQKELKISPVNYKNKIRIKRSFTYLTDTKLSVEEIAEKLNFKSATHFRKEFKKQTSSTPTAYRKLFYNSIKP